jgi:hypothetical protein
LSDEVFSSVVQTFISYYEKEKDYRGYQTNVGWLHSIAHAADLFSQILQNPLLPNEQVQTIFEVIKKKFMIHDYMFVHDEDERTINAIEKAVRNNVVDEEYMVSYIKSFSNFEKGNVFPDAYNILRNVKCLLRSLYFRFLDDEKYSYITEEVKAVLKEIK